MFLFSCVVIVSVVAACHFYNKYQNNKKTDKKKQNDDYKDNETNTTDEDICDLFKKYLLNHNVEVEEKPILPTKTVAQELNELRKKFQQHMIMYLDPDTNEEEKEDEENVKSEKKEENEEKKDNFIDNEVIVDLVPNDIGGLDVAFSERDDSIV